MGRNHVRSLFIFAGIILCATNLFAQGTSLGTIRGTVSDASGGRIPNAKIQIVDLETNISRELTTDHEGNYEASGVKSGNYKVVITVPGFAQEEIQGVVLTGTDIVRADAHMQPARASETVSITAEAPVIETETQTISQTLDNKALTELPRDSRDIYSFLYLNPNITQGDVDGDFKFIGSQTYGANFSLDGQRSNGGIFGQPTASQPSLEAIGELKILSNDFTAEYAGVANIRVETRRGGREYHGSAFYNNKNSALAAWNLQDKNGKATFLPTPAEANFPNPFFNLNEIGGSVGGPVPMVKKTFFFLAYERQWSAAPVQFRSTTLPHPSLWTGDFSQLKDANKPQVPAGVTLTAAEIANNTVGGLGKRFITIPQRLLNPVTANLIKDYFPQINPALPINSTNGRVSFFDLRPGISVRDLGTSRLDHDFSERDKFYGVYNVSAQTTATSPVVSPFEGLGLTQRERLNHTLSLSYTRLISTATVNEVRGGFNQQNLLARSNQTLRQFLTRIGFDQSDIAAYGAVAGASALDTFGHPAVFFGSGFQNFTNGGRNTFRPQDQNLATFGDTFTRMMGKHTLKFGADLVRNSAIDGFANNRGNPRGLITYTGAGPDAFARFIMGLPANRVSFIQALRPPMDVHNWEQGYFAQDDFRIHPRVTINLGMRYELITPFIEKNDLMVNFDPTFVNPNGNKGRFVIPSQKTMQYMDPRMIAYGVATASQLGLGRGLVRIDKTNLAPRVGVAWRISDKTVLRGGYGIYYPTSAAQAIRDAIATNPFNQTRSATNTSGSPLSPWPGFVHGVSPLTGGQIQNTAGSAPSANAIPFGLRQPRIHQYNVTFERELGYRTAVRVSYLGTKMTRLMTGFDLNEIPPNNTPFGTTMGDGVTICDPNNGDCNLSPADQARLPFTTLGDNLFSYGNFGHGLTNALQIEANRRFSSGFMFSASYTLLSQNSSAVDSGNASLGGVAYNPFSPDSDYSRDSFVPRHRFIAYGIYEVPFGNGRRFGSSMPKWLDAVAGGWQTAFNMFIKSGTGFTPYWTCDNCGPAFPGNIGSSSIDAVGDFGPGTSFRPLVTGNVYTRNGDQFFNPDAFGLPPIGADIFSNPAVAKRNSLIGPGTWGVNLGIHKVFRFGEQVKADLGADFNNVFNHPLFSPDEGGGDNLSNLGSFSIDVDQKTGKILPITNVTPNPDFGRLITSFSQENIDSRRTVRLKLRITF